MEEPLNAPVDPIKIEVILSEAEFAILEKYRGELGVSEFIKLALRIVDSGAVSDVPAWAASKLNDENKAS